MATRCTRLHNVTNFFFCVFNAFRRNAFCICSKPSYRMGEREANPYIEIIWNGIQHKTNGFVRFICIPWACEKPPNTRDGHSASAHRPCGVFSISDNFGRFCLFLCSHFLWLLDSVPEFIRMSGADFSEISSETDIIFDSLSNSGSTKGEKLADSTNWK